MDLTKGSEANSPTDLDSEHENAHDENLSRSPPPSLEEIEPNAQTLVGTSEALGFGGEDFVPLEATGILLLGILSLHHRHFL